MTRPEKTKFYLVIFILLTSFISVRSYGQDEPSVQVDMDVLNAIAPAAGIQNYYHASPVQRPRKPSLTGPSVNNRVQKPTIARKSQQPQNDIVSFPVNFRDRTELYDPSLEKTPTYVKTSIKRQKPVTNILLPELTPVKTVVQKIKVPIPPRRPSILKASAKFVKQARKEVLSDLSKGGMAMPAVPPQKVQAEPLNPPKAIKITNNDALAKRLIIPDKKSMVSSIEAVAALADALMPVVPSTRQKKVNIDPIPVPAHKPETANSIIAKMEQAIDVSSIEPAAGIAETKVTSLFDITEPLTPMPSENKIPRNPPEDDFELEYISLPFAPGIAKLDEKITESLNQKVIPLLKDNPRWRLQIQAFAGKTENGLKNARRTSLSRALSIRSHLLDQGIEARRMDVRALGMQTDRNPVDRVDFVFFDPAQR